ncbi:hypothetical protein KAU09_01095 [Candidatus Parcubacteria bacterium]|nr:hypothetical protein [Candidatus Parcubacteria bacterium]
MKKIVSVFLFLLLFLTGFLPFDSCLSQAGGAVLFLSPSTGDYNVGRSFTVSVAVNSGGGSGINAAEGSIKYDNSYLTVSKLSDTGSIFKLWTTDPTYSNSAGTISFGGGSPGPYKGTNGTIFTITFSTKKIGTTEVKFSSGIVLAADGKGTNIFSGFGNARFNIIEAEKKEEKPKPKPKQEKKDDTPKGLLPPLPDISSETHPETDIWYQNNNPEFTWKILADLTGVSFLITDSPDSDPGPESDGIIENAVFDEDVADGEQYFHIKYKNKSGWSQIAHRKFLVDVTPPKDFDIAYDSGGDPTNPAAKLRFKTEDKASGLDYYKISIDGIGERIGTRQMDKGYYQLQPLDPGRHEVQVAAYDKAGNAASSSIDFMVEPLKAPIITSIPKIINKKDELIIRGTSFYPQVTIKIYIGKEGEDPIEASVKTDDESNWSYFHKDELEKGMYEVRAKLIDDRGAQSLDSTKYFLSVVSLSIIDRFGLWIIIILLIIIALLVLYIMYQRKEFNDEKTRIMRETAEVKIKLAKIFFALREELDELLQMADKKPGFSEAERKVKEKLEESLDISEEFISKEVTDVEKEIKLPKKKEK